MLRCNRKIDHWLRDPVRAALTIIVLIITTGVMDILNFMLISNEFIATVNIIVAILIIFVVDRSKKVTK